MNTTLFLLLLGLVTLQIVRAKPDDDDDDDDDDSSSRSSSEEKRISYTDLESDIISRCLGIQSYTSIVVSEFYSLPSSGSSEYVSKMRNQLDTLKLDADELEFSIDQYIRNLNDYDNQLKQLAANTRTRLREAYTTFKNRLERSISEADTALDRYQFVEHTLSPPIMNLQTTCTILVNHIQHQKFSDD